MSVKIADPRLFWEVKVLTLQRLLYIQTSIGVDTTAKTTDGLTYNMTTRDSGNKIMAD